ncbi:MAG: PilN domain-containing protein [Planctomycetota bacterium]
MTAHSVTDDLLYATGHEPALDRRKKDTRVKHDRRARETKAVGLEVSPNGIALSFVVGEGAERQLTTRHIVFGEESGPRRGDFTDGTLDSILSKLSAEHNLAGQAVSIALGGDPCVTRFVTGNNEDVDIEVEELTTRTARYIGMGLGEKVSCQTTKSLDARRKRVWVTVARRDFVDAVAHAVQNAGMRVARIEHTMVVLSRLLNLLAKDEEGPVLMVVDELGRINLGMSFRGRLMLDYRPAMPDPSASRGSIVQRHLKCLRRYIQARLPEVAGELENVYFTGLGDDCDALCESLNEQSDLNACRFPLQQIYGELRVDGEVSEDPGVLASVSLATYSFFLESDQSVSDLASTLHTTGRVPWLKLIACSWPLALAGALALALFGYGAVSSHAVRQAEAQIEALSLRRVEANATRLNLQRRREREEHVQALSQQLPKPGWALVVWKVGKSLPEKMWLESMEFNHQGKVRIVGAGYADQAVFEFIDRLRASGQFTRVALDGTNSIRGNEGTTFQFELSARLAERSGNATEPQVASGLTENPNG